MSDDTQDQESVTIDDDHASKLAAVGLAGIGVNAAALVIMPLLRPDVDFLHDGLSHYAVGPWAGVQTAAFVALGIGCLGIAGALWLISAGQPWTQVAAVTLGLAAINAAGLALFPMGDGGLVTPLGDLHLTVGTLAISLQFIAAAALVVGHRTWDYGGHVTRLAGLLLGLSLLAAGWVQLAIWRPDLEVPEGLAMRLVVVPLLLWWALVALAIRRRTAHEHRADVPGAGAHRD